MRLIRGGVFDRLRFEIVAPRLVAFLATGLRLIAPLGKVVDLPETMIKSVKLLI